MPPELASSDLAKLTFEAPPEKLDAVRMHKAIKDGELICGACEVYTRSSLFHILPEMDNTWSFAGPLLEPNPNRTNRARVNFKVVPEMEKSRVQAHQDEGANVPRGVSMEMPMRLEVSTRSDSALAEWAEGFLSRTELHLDAGLAYVEEKGGLQAGASVVGQVRPRHDKNIWGTPRLVLAVPVAVPALSPLSWQFPGIQKEDED